MTTAPSRQRRVLVVDDDDDSRELLEELLNLSGHCAVTAASAAEALDKITSEKPDLALIDLSLPDADGCEVARQVRERLGRDIRLVALTGYSDPVTRQRAFDSGFDRFVVKPLIGNTLEALLLE
ncbi:MAG TPA: response regulator [Polyangiaceae bacterium]|jgi:CheY-like chemotaxis protein|nr:response regulator [Polyangiaceae bacterium]